MKTPLLCKSCPNKRFWEDGECWMYWKGKEFCAEKGWLQKEKY